VSKEKNVKKQKPHEPIVARENKPGTKRQQQQQTSTFDEELNNLKARSGIFTHKKNKKPQVITLAPSLFSPKVLTTPIDLNANENAVGPSIEMNHEFVKPSETNRFHVLQETDPASFKMILQPSLLSKYIPGSSIDESDI
jgi:hypothetical protein